MAVVLSMVFGRSILVTMVPTAIGRYRAYSAVEDRAYFEEVLSWELETLGARPGKRE